MMASWMLAARAALYTSSSLADGRPYLQLKVASTVQNSHGGLSGIPVLGFAI